MQQADEEDDNVVLAQTNDGDWRWLPIDKAMPNPSGGFWIERPTAKEANDEDI
jgi:hypothetical protein